MVIRGGGRNDDRHNVPQARIFTFWMYRTMMDTRNMLRLKEHRIDIIDSSSKDRTVPHPEKHDE
jgi:hypothetical protein